MKPLVSLIVPIYKVEMYLDKCIQSLVNQTYNNLEILLVDDGSPDSCPQMCDKWKEKDDRIKVIHKKNGGLSDARNAGLDIATGEYIGFIDSDDWVAENYVEKMLHILLDEKADIVECGIAYIDENERLIKNRVSKVKQKSCSKKEALKELIKENGIYQTVWNKLYSREVIENVKFSVGKLNEDDFWTYQVFDKANKIIVIDDILYFYLQRKSSIMGAGYTLKRLDGLQARVERAEYLQKYDDLADFSSAYIWFDFLYHYQCAIKWLDKENQEIAISYINDKIKLSRIVYCNEISIKYQIWFALFRKFPYMTAKIRNCLGIGI